MNQTRPTKMWCLTLLLCFFGLTCSQVFADVGTEAIVGGDYAKKDVFKYHAEVLSAGLFRRGGVIIDNFYILTAAHCVAVPPGIVPMHSFSVMVGMNDRKNKHDAIVDSVESVYIPKVLNFTTNENDLAILKLKNGLNLSAYHHKIEKVNLPSANANFDGVTAVLTGFGANSIKIRRNKEGKLESYDPKYDDRLKYAHVRIFSNAKCSELYKKTILPSWICGEVLQRSKNPEGACKGDSGSPLVYENQVIGILSKGIFTCYEKNNPAIYMRTSSYVNMIHNVITGKPGNNVVHVKVPQ